MSGALNAATIFSDSLTLSGATISDVEAVGPVTAGVRINNDGTVDSLISTSYAQISSATDWVLPNATNRTYHAKAEQVSTSGGGSKTGDLSSWKQITGGGGANYEWKIERADGAGSGTSQWVVDISISGDAGSTTLVTGRYTLNATIT